MERLTPADFEGTRLKRTDAFAVVFSADWCPFCRSFLPRFASREGTLAVRFGLADVTDLHNPWWELFEIRVVPSVLGFREGQLAWRINGRRMRGLGDHDLDRMGQLVTAP